MDVVVDMLHTVREMQLSYSSMSSRPDHRGNLESRSVMPWKWKSSSVRTRLDKGLGGARQRYATLCLYLAEVFKH